MIAGLNISALSDAQGQPGAGGKAEALSQLLRAGFDVPDGFVVTGLAFTDALGADTAERLQAVLDTARERKIALSEHCIEATLANLALAPEMLAAIEAKLDPTRTYAVRSSSIDEDTADASAAGIHESFLAVAAAEVPVRIVDCYRSSLSEQALTYALDHDRVPALDGFGVIVQDMVRADVSGVAFSVDPVTGADTHVVIESTAGYGDQLVSGRVEGSRTVVDWFNDRVIERGALTDTQREQVVTLAREVQGAYGRPYDIEWAFDGDQLWLLQARPITRIQHAGVDIQWTSANFKDGGVAADVCTPLMGSIYNGVWQEWYPKFLVSSRLITPEQGSEPAIGMFFSRPYWNLSMGKTAMATAPGYVEREFDEELGVTIAYDGPGVTTSLNPSSMATIGLAALKQSRFLHQMERDVQGLHTKIVSTAVKRESRLAEGLSGAELGRVFESLVTTDVDLSQGWYFWQVYLNTIHQQLARESLVKAVGEEAYVDLISGLDDLSHLRSFNEAWRISRALRASSYWVTTPVTEIVADLQAGEEQPGFGMVRDFVCAYGYHSAKELDISWPDFSEDPTSLVAMIRDAVGLDDEYGPEADRERHRIRFTSVMNTARAQMGSLKFQRFEARVERMRQLLWWREELRDTSTRMLHVIRLASLQLGRVLVDEGALHDPDDVFFATRETLIDYLHGRFGAVELLDKVARGKEYYRAFRNYQPDAEIGRMFDGSAVVSGAEGLTGHAASNGVVEGVARVIDSLEDVDRLQPGDILVTRFTDPGWAGRFATLGGLVTETGGVLCHAAVVAREYGIPCVVAVTDATVRIPDGARVRLDGGSGVVTLL